MRKKIFLIFLLLLLVLTGSALWFFFFHQPEPVVTDETQGEGRKTESDSGGSRENEGVLNKNIHIYTGDDAKAVNESITSVEFGNNELTLRFAGDTESGLAVLGRGDIFWLDGSESTPLKETYIGKVMSNTLQGEERAVTVESPMIDEVFDELYLDGEFAVSADNIKTISTVDGVTVKPVEAVPADFLEAAPEENAGAENTAMYTELAHMQDTAAISADLGNFVLEIDVDLMELLNIVDSGKNAQGEKSEAKKKQDDIARVKDSCKVTGRIGMEDLKVSFTADYDKDEYGMKELSAGVSGRQVFSAGLDMSISGEVSGKTTEADVLGFIKLQGLKKKVFPIAYFDCTSGVPVSISGIGNTLNKNIENKNTYMPFSCGFMVYIDIYGNLSLDVKMNYSYADTFENNLILVRDNKIVGSFENSANEPEINYYAGIKASADADVHIGTSALLYLFNINIVDVGIAKAGGEILGTGSLEASSNEEKNSGVNASFYARLYVKILDVKAAIKAQANLWKLSLSAGFDWAETMLDLTLLETGQKRDTHFDENSMMWHKMTAEDENSFYYKGTNGNLLRESKNLLSRTTLYEGEFFSICGLDQSYIYVLEPAGDESYDVRRIGKDGAVTKIILEDVKYVLLMEGNVFYYVPAFSENLIYTLDRYSLEKKKFAQFEDNVELMSEEDGAFLVTVQEDNAFSWLLGPECKYYLLSEDGQTLEVYEDDLTPQQCVKEDNGSYYAAFEIISNGYLRETATKGYWLSENEQSSVEAEGVSGWNPTESGIFTELEGENRTYDVVLYQASDGSPRKITETDSANAFFTFVQDDAGNWYYMDQTETDLELYRMNASFTEKEKIDTISLEEVPCDMESCTMELVNNRIFFYTMPSWSDSEVLYRYNLY